MRRFPFGLTALLAGFSISACNCGSTSSSSGATTGIGLSGASTSTGAGTGTSSGSTTGTVTGSTTGSSSGCGLKTCASVAANCGPIGDGCGDVLQCGTCTLPETCGGGGTPSVCGGHSGCIPATCESAHANCGPLADGCGNLVQCGGCDAGSCGGGGQPNVCGSALPVDAGVLVVFPMTSTLAVQSATPATAQLQALLQTSAGSTPVSANWSSSRPEIAAIDQTGLVTASGPLAGTATITAGYLGQLADAQVAVTVTQTVITSGGSSFSGTPTLGASSPAFLYPFDQTVIPVNLQPLDFQWQPGAGNDLFQLTLTGPQSTLTAFVSPANAAQPDYAFDPSVWQPFAQSNVGQTVTVELAGTSSATPGVVWAAPSQSLTLASSRMAGDIYYWSVSAGEILSLPAGSVTPTPITVPAADVNTSNQSSCIACHAVSPDGSKLSAELWGGGNPGTVLDLSTSTSAPPALVTGAAGILWDFSTFDSTGSLLVVSNNGDLTLRDSQTGAPVPSTTSEGNLTSLGCGPGSTCTQPVWSRDGQYLVFAQGVAGDFANDYTFSASNLMIAQWAALPQTFSAPTTLVTNNYDGNVLANVYPTISVDDSLVAFTRSTCSYASTDPCAHTSTLAVLSSDGGVPIELTNAELMGDAGIDDSSRFPNFSPFKEGGYHWMAFFSMRNYGWVTTNQRQIWLTAVDDNQNPVSDPSHPAFWLPGQDPTTENDKAEWATLPCVGQGQTCQGDIDCCGASDGGLVCVYADGGSTCEPPPQSCGFWGTTCASNADCCSPTQCELGVCCTPLTCASLGYDCGQVGDGCGNLLSCGDCTAPQTCGGGGEPSVCGSPDCTPATCASLGYTCGAAGDGCGGLLQCGSCDAGTCGGGFQVNQCGSPSFE